MAMFKKNTDGTHMFMRYGIIFRDVWWHQKSFFKWVNLPLAISYINQQSPSYLSNSFYWMLVLDITTLLGEWTHLWLTLWPFCGGNTFIHLCNAGWWSKVLSETGNPFNNKTGRLIISVTRFNTHDWQPKHAMNSQPRSGGCNFGI